MKIELTEQEYGHLLDVVHIAEVVLSGHRRVQDPLSAPQRAVIQKVYAQATAAGLGRLVAKHEGHADNGHYVPTAEFESRSLAHRALDEFSDHLFWDELIGRLSVRDAARNMGGKERLAALNDDARQAAEGPVRERYIDEFQKHGLENIVVVEDFVASGKTTVRTSD